MQVTKNPKTLNPQKLAARLQRPRPAKVKEARDVAKAEI